MVSVSKHEHRLTPLIIVCRYYEYANDNDGNAAARLTYQKENNHDDK